MVREGRPVGSRSWIPRHLQGISINSSNQFVFSLFRTNCTAQDKETTLVPLSRMTRMYNLIWLVGKAESPGPSSPVGPKTCWIPNRNVTHAPSPLQLAKAGSLGKQEHTPWEDGNDLWMQNKNYLFAWSDANSQTMAMFFLDPLVGFILRHPKLCGPVYLSKVLSVELNTELNFLLPTKLKL